MPTAAEIVEAMDLAIKRGVLEVRHADGRLVRYPTLADLLRARDVFLAELRAAEAGGIERIRRTTLAYFPGEGS